ncbi:hypothetical protein TELCIR_09745 [Teladorsagia circumcincta]|uniref:Uncharacterized protein n=2 Tax=Teladorsagia circumcincta TaxID=45464 RepID=A0A2G9UE13_TELCI|nr:hypothetical protein TELCIR_09745 [Teladorsagia circumcincta]
MFRLLPKSRFRRATYNFPKQTVPAVEQEGPEMWNTHIPEDVEVEKENNTVDHKYYITTIYLNRHQQMDNYWVDIDEMLKKPGVVGNASHPLLSGTYRRAVGAKLSFKFPFYGHMMTNLTIATGDNYELPLILRYEDSSPMFRLLPKSRFRRATYNFPKQTVPAVEQEGPEMWNTHIPEDVEVEKENNTVDHKYYITTIYLNRHQQMDNYWVDIDEMLKKPGVVGNASHPLLSGTYRRAVGAKLSFKFPFYGHMMTNLTIATGGFLYIGDQTHNWLAATQYIAPLMANFDTMLDGSSILYADDGEKFVVEWRKVQLREQHQAGPFTFQTTLFKNGSIAFVYKSVPMNVSNISDEQHPVKCGISDAYLYHHMFMAHGTMSPKRVIYEYHRIEIPLEKVVPDTVVYLEAQPGKNMYCNAATDEDEVEDSSSFWGQSSVTKLTLALSDKFMGQKE